MKDIATEQYNFIDIIIEGWSIYKAILKKSIPILLIVMLPVNWLTEYVIARINFSALVAAGKITAANAAKAQLQIGNIIQAVIGSIALLALMKLAEMHITRREITWKEALSHGINRYPQMLVAGFLLVLYVFIPIFLCGTAMPILVKMKLTAVAVISMILIIIGACYLLGIYAFFPYAVGLTSASGLKSLRYSKKLVRGRFWQVASFFIGLGVVCGLFSVLTASVGWAASSAIGHFFHNIPMGLAVFIDGICDFTGDFAIPFQMAVLTIFFLNTAYLKDGAR